MRVFVTGASGFIGSAVVQELLGAGHEVLGLARSDAAADSLSRAGAAVHRGSLDDLASLRAGADAADGVVHTAYKHDLAFSGGFAEAAAHDHVVVAELAAALAGSDRPLVIASGTAGLPAGRVSTERDVADPTSHGAARLPSEQAVLAAAADGVRSSVLRLPPSVHGEGDQGFVATLVQVARDRGASGYVGDGSNRWPAVHRLDAARLFRLAVEQAPAGSVLHAPAEEGIAVRDLAEVIGRHLDLPLLSVAPEEAGTHFGWLGAFIGADVPSSSALTQELLDWRPTHPGLVADLEEGHYFEMLPSSTP